MTEELYRHVKTLQGHNGPVVAVLFSSNGARVASASVDRTIRIWEADEKAGPSYGRCIATCHGPSPVNCIAWAPANVRQGSLIASGSDDGALMVWDSQRGHPERRIDTAAGPDSPPASVMAVAWSDTGALIATGDAGGGMVLWEMPAGDPRRLAAKIRSHAHADQITGLAFLRKSEDLVSVSVDGLVRLWDVASVTKASPASHLLCKRTILAYNDRPPPLPVPMSAVSISMNGKFMLLGTMDGMLRLIDIAKERAVVSYSQGPTQGFLTPALATPNRKRQMLACGSDDSGKITIWHAGSAQVLQVIPEATLGPDGQPQGVGHRGSVLACHSHANLNGAYIVSGSSDPDRTVKIWKYVGPQD